MSEVVNDARELTLEGEFKRSQIVGFLEDLIAGLRSGQVMLQRENDALVLSPGEAMKLSLHAANDDLNEIFRLEMAWNRSVQNAS